MRGTYRRREGHAAGAARAEREGRLSQRSFAFSLLFQRPRMCCRWVEVNPVLRLICGGLERRRTGMLTVSIVPRSDGDLLFRVFMLLSFLNPLNQIF